MAKIQITLKDKTLTIDDRFDEILVTNKNEDSDFNYESGTKVIKDINGLFYTAQGWEDLLTLLNVRGSIQNL